ncbi:hypothetical protein B0H14DRAFT_3888357 [Mycena olivaceomarginata]|nr:hypothetical protein B0H14DRAFT_3888357 [Mycena olivaceomarginata]
MRVRQAEQESKKRKHPSPVTTSQRMDRGIRKVTSLWGEVSEIIFNAKLYDKKPAEEDEDEDIDEDAEDLTPEEMEYLAEKRELIQRLVPNLHERLRTKASDSNTSSQEIMDFFRSLQKGANDARSEDIRTLSVKVAEWLNEMEQKRFTSESAVAEALTAAQGTDASGSLAAARESVKAAHFNPRLRYCN